MATTGAAADCACAKNEHSEQSSHAEATTGPCSRALSWLGLQTRARPRDRKRQTHHGRPTTRSARNAERYAARSRKRPCSRTPRSPAGRACHRRGIQQRGETSEGIATARGRTASAQPSILRGAVTTVNFGMLSRGAAAPGCDIRSATDGGDLRVRASSRTTCADIMPAGLRGARRASSSARALPARCDAALPRAPPSTPSAHRGG